jgi:hypothetical protein
VSQRIKIFLVLLVAIIKSIFWRRCRGGIKTLHHAPSTAISGTSEGSGARRRNWKWGFQMERCVADLSGGAALKSASELPEPGAEPQLASPGAGRSHGEKVTEED